MQLQNLVCSLEQSKKLNELGIWDVSYFYHDTNCGSVIPLNLVAQKGGLYSAFTCSELGVILPDYCCVERCIYPDGRVLWTTYEGLTGDCHEEINENMAVSMAAMAIHLLSKKIIDVDDCNNRLNSI